MTSPYDAIASVYDKINAEIDYSAWADFIEKCFDKYLNFRPSLVFDMACGTGSMTIELARRGYDMIGSDISQEMLYKLYDKLYDEDGEPIPEIINDVLVLNQDMRDFELYGTVGAVTCCLDSINYLTDPNDLKKCFSCVHNYLDPDGLFIFDVNTPYKFENIYANNSYIYECINDDGSSSYCGWQNNYDPETKLCDFYLSVFTENEKGHYIRSDEEQTERCYSEEELIKTLKSCGLEPLEIFSDLNFSETIQDCERWYIVARAIK